MAYESPLLHRLRLIAEPTFGTDQTSVGTSFTSFLELPIIRGTFQGNREEAQLAPMTNEQFMDYDSFDERGKLTCAPTFDTLLHSHGVEIDGNTAGPDHTTWGFAALLKSGCMGGLSVATAPGATTQVQAATTATTINVTAGHGAKFTPGRAIGVIINGRLEARPVLSVSTDAVSVKTAFSDVPATGSTVYGSTTIHLTDTDNSASLQIAYEGKETSHRYGYLGCNGGFTLALNDGLAKMTFNLLGTGWLKYGTTALAAQTVANYQPIVSDKDSELIVSEVGDTTRYAIHGTSDWVPNIVWQRLTSTMGPEGVVRNRRIHQPSPISGTLTKFRDGGAVYDFHAAQTAKTPLCFLRQLGSAAGGTVLLEAPTVQVWVPQDGEIDGADAEPIAWRGFQESDISSPSSDLERAAFRMHFF